MRYAVVTVTRNCAGTIGRTIRSVLAQSFLPDRYIIVDAESADGTVEEARRGLAEADFPVDVLSQTGRGIASAWNQGLRHLLESTDSDLVCIINGDDWYDSDTLECVRRSFAESPGTDIAAGSIRLWEAHSGVPAGWASPAPLWLFPLKMPLLHPACFVLRSVYERVGGFDESLEISADYEFLFRAYRGGVRIRRDARIVVNMQAGGAASCNRRTARRETLRAGFRHTRFGCLPYLAYWLRTIGRR